MSLNFKKIISLDNPFRLLYHKLRAIIASLVYGFPSKGMTIIGVTGTNGKTTTCNIIAKSLQKSGKKIFMFSTVNFIIGDKEYINNTKMTSPDAFFLQKLLKEAKNEGCEIAIIETASHGIKMNRVWGIDYDIAVLTNITRDHLDLHKTMKDYVATKLKLFKNLITKNRKQGVKKTAIINLESEYKDIFLKETYDVLYSYGVGPKSNLKIQNVKNNLNNTTFDIVMPSSTLKINTSLRGLFNVYNITAAIGVLISLNFNPNEIEEAIKAIGVIPGRLEEIENKEGFKIFVDYAHTADALEQVLTTLKDIKGIKNILTVFGATGDRDKVKRPMMGEVVSRLSNKVILTQDDDYSEKPENIMKDILPGIERKEGEDFWIMPDREEAIRIALLSAEKDDVVLIAGKGDEHTMVTNAGSIEWHDKSIIKNILKEIDDNRIVK